MQALLCSHALHTVHRCKCIVVLLKTAISVLSSMLLVQSILTHFISELTVDLLIYLRR